MKLKDRQIEIIRAAGEILTESGVPGLTTKKIAARMGFAESALYRHFKGKEEIILTMLLYLADDMERRLKDALHSSPDAEVQLKELFKSQFEFFGNNPHFLVAVFSDGLLEESESVHSAILKIMAAKRKILMQVIALGQKQQVFTKKLTAEELAHIIMGSFRLHMLQWRMTNMAFDVSARGNKMLTGILSLIKA
jgi:AcrR family transcriptional regulator